MKFKTVDDYSDTQTKIDIILASIERCRSSLKKYPAHLMVDSLTKRLLEEEKNLCSMKHTHPDYFI